MNKQTLFFTWIVLSLISLRCQYKCGFVSVFELCNNSETKNLNFIEYEFDNFSINAPETWSFEQNKNEGFTNYIFMNDLERSEYKNNSEIFTITTVEVTDNYNFVREFDNYIQDQNIQENRQHYEIDKSMISGYTKKAGVYVTGIDTLNNLKFENIAIWILDKSRMYWLNCSSTAKSKEDLNVCTSKMIVNTFSSSIKTSR